MSFEYAIGYLESFLAVILFGSIYVSVKKYNAHDGIFDIFLLAISNFMVGCVIFAFQGFSPKIYPLVMLSGVIWTIGNTAVISIIRQICLAIGYLIWNTTKCIVGWSMTYFGLFGVAANPATIPWMNFVGVAIVMIGGIIFTFVQNSDNDTTNTENITESDLTSIEVSPTPMMSKHPILKIGDFPMEKSKRSITVGKENRRKINGDKQRVIGIVMAALAGCVFGITFLPIFYMQNNPDAFENAPKDLLLYLFSQYLGILITATCEFFLYSIVKKKQITNQSRARLTSLASGLIFGSAQAMMFGATKILTASITLPIVAMMHGLIVASWSIFYFKEIQGKRNLIMVSWSIFYFKQIQEKRNYILTATAICVNLTAQR